MPVMSRPTTVEVPLSKLISHFRVCPHVFTELTLRFGQGSGTLLAERAINTTCFQM